MITSELEKELTKVEKYLLRQGRVDLMNELKNLKPEELKNRLLKQALHHEEILDAKSSDTELQDTKDKVRDLQGPYNDSLRMNKKISRYINLLLKDKSE